MAAQQQPYVSYEDLRSYLKIPDNSEDTLLQLLIPKAMEFIDHYTGRTFGWGNPDDPTDITYYKSVTDDPPTANGELYDGFAGKILYLYNMDIVSIDEVKLGISSLDSWTILQPNNYVWRDDGRLILGGNYFNAYDSDAYTGSDANFFGAIAAGYQTVSVKYHYGVYGVPPSIALACLDICLALYTIRKNLGIRQERIGDWQVEYQANVRAQLKNQPDTLGALNLWKRRKVGVAQ